MAKTTKRKQLAKNKASNKSIADARIEKYYNKIVFGFIAVTALLIIVIVYFSFSKTDITITVKPNDTELSLDVNIQELGGTVLITDVEATGIGQSSGETREVIGRASGIATIINKSSSSQPLVATTRLLSKEGVLFRTQESVVAPANGSIDVPVAADEEGEQGDIEPSTFEIVALNESSKQFIYAESSEAMTGGRNEVGVVSQTDVANALGVLDEEILKKAKDAFTAEMNDREEFAQHSMLIDDFYLLKTNAEQSDVQAGDEASEFTVTKNVTVAGVVVDTDTFQEYLNSVSSEHIPRGSRLTAEPDIQTANVSIASANEDNTGSLSVTLPVHTTIDLTSDVLNAQNLTNKSAQEVQEYLESFEEIDSVELHFSPFWVRTTPSVADNISIHIK